MTTTVTENVGYNYTLGEIFVLFPRDAALIDIIYTSYSLHARSELSRAIQVSVVVSLFTDATPAECYLYSVLKKRKKKRLKSLEKASRTLM